MKCVAGLSAWLAFAAVLCFAPSALGQSPLMRVPVAGFAVSSNATAGFLALTLGPAGRGGNNQNPGNGCSNQGGPKGWDSRSSSAGADWGAGCSTSVPEGGSALMYLILAALCCVGALRLRSPRQASVRQSI
jgi:hypothetical protein